MMIYFIMHENVKVALVQITNGSVDRVAFNNKTYEYMPIGVKTENDLKEWVKNRGIPVTRHRVDVDLQVIGVSTPFELMLNNYGVSLTDHYWICPVDSNHTWESINLYTNNFSSIFSLDLRDDTGIADMRGKTNFIPSTSLKGDLKKKWIIEPRTGERILVKGNYGRSCRQSISEVFATEMHKIQGKFPYTPYSFIKISSDGQMIFGCQCPNFAGIHTEFIPAHDIAKSYKTPQDSSEYEEYLRFCYENGIDLRNFMEYQIMMDFLITNSDRHFNNFGVIRDSRTLKFIGPAPIFDSGNSLFYNTDYVPNGKGLLDIPVTSFRRKEVDLLKYVHNRGIVDLSRLPSEELLFKLLSIDTTASQSDCEKVVNAYKQKIKYLLDFQNGAKLWSYNYKG